MLNTMKGCSTSRKKEAVITFKNSFASSQDFPFFYALTKKHAPTKTQLLTLYRDFFMDKSNTLKHKKNSSIQLSYDLSYGNVESTPQAVHKFAHKITQTLFNSEFETDPYSIDQFQQADLSRSIENYYSGALSSKNPIQKYLKRSSAKIELRKILRSPIYNQNGALKSFQNIAGARFLFAKSGSQLTKTNAVKDQWTVGAFTQKGRKYTFLIFVGTDSNNEEGLGQRIRSKTLIYPIMNEVLKSLSTSK